MALLLFSGQNYCIQKSYFLTFTRAENIALKFRTHTQGYKLAPVIGHLSAKFEVLTGKLRSLIGHPDGPLL